MGDFVEELTHPKLSKVQSCQLKSLEKHELTQKDHLNKTSNFIALADDFSSKIGDQKFKISPENLNIDSSSSHFFNAKDDKDPCISEISKQKDSGRSHQDKSSSFLSESTISKLS